MPRITGLQLAEAIREQWPEMAVILATGYAELESGAGKGIRKLSKPFTEGQLAEELARVCLSSGGRPQLQDMFKY